LGYGSHEGLGVWHAHFSEQRCGRSLFDYPTSIHHRDLVGTPGDNGKIVRH
jgi:hypothetical protein